MVAFDPIFIAVLGALIALFFFVYLFLRRIATGFREGYESSRDE